MGFFDVTEGETEAGLAAVRAVLDDAPTQMYTAPSSVPRPPEFLALKSLEEKFKEAYDNRKQLAARVTGKELLSPGAVVRISRVDPYGLWGRDEHPPVNNSVDGELPTSPVDGKLAIIVAYLGWESDAGDNEMVSGNWGDPRDPETVFKLAAVKQAAADADPPNPGEKLLVTHYYRAVVPESGIYEFADYELEGYGD